MKKFFTLLAAALLSAAAYATDYKDSLIVSVNGYTAEQNATVSLTQTDGLYTFTLKNFMLTLGSETMAIGTINIDNLSPAGTAGDYILLHTERDINIVAGDDESVTTWMGPNIGAVPIKLTAKVSDEKVYASISITMADLNQVIDVTFGSGYQLPNSGFELWHTATMDKATSEEPNTWHSFMSSTGKFASFVGKTPHVFKSTRVREGATGANCAMITSSKVFGSIIANGTLTTGRLKAGAMTASSTSNNSFIDMSLTDKDGNNEYFYPSFIGHPDAMKVWVKFKQGTPNAEHPYATVSAAITDGTYYQDPEDKAYTNVLAKAKNNTIVNKDGEWQQLTIPFTYEDETITPKTILVTISTNADAGKGSTDTLYVDDISFVYNVGIKSVSANEDKTKIASVDLNGAGAFYTVSYSDDGTKATVTAYSEDLKDQVSQQFTLANLTAISSVEAATKAKQMTIYNLQGQRVSRMEHGNIYIVNGKKVVY